jgi:hypothetical protein
MQRPASIEELRNTRPSRLQWSKRLPRRRDLQHRRLVSGGSDTDARNVIHLRAGWFLKPDFLVDRS